MTDSIKPSGDARIVTGQEKTMSEPLERLQRLRTLLVGHVDHGSKPGVGHLHVSAIVAHALTAIEDEFTRRELKTSRYGIVPDRETYWLVERNVSPPQYVSLNSAGWHSDPWQARRFNTERDAHDYWRMMGEFDRPQFKIVEHMFVNKP